MIRRLIEEYAADETSQADFAMETNGTCTLRVEDESEG
jgi:hypothetical protein